MLESAVVKFVGQVDNSYGDYRIYVGVKLDEPGKKSLVKAIPPKKIL